MSKSLIISELSPIDSQRNRTNLGCLASLVRTSTPEIGPDRHIQIALKIQKHLEQPLGIISSLLQSETHQNISIVWEHEEEPFKLEGLLSFDDRRPSELSKVSIGKNIFTVPAYLEPIIRNGSKEHYSDLPPVALAPANQFLKTQTPGTVKIALSLKENNLGTCDDSLTEWMKITGNLVAEYPALRFFLLNPTLYENFSPNELEKSGIVPVRARGIDEFGALGLAAMCDVYTGVLNEHALAAASNNKTGLYILGEEFSDFHNNEKRQWFLRDPSGKEISDIFREIIQGKDSSHHLKKAASSWQKSSTAQGHIGPTPDPNCTSSRETHSNTIDKQTTGWQKRVADSPFFVAEESRDSITLYVDVFGHCNLRCPSCPVGNWSKNDGKTFTPGLIDESTLRKIIEKSLAETKVTSIGLFNWTEPLLNPNIARLVQIVKSYGIKCSISSNLNILRDPLGLMSSNVDWLRVSVSGFTQDLYKLNHVGGNIEIVKENMKRLAEAKAEASAQTDLELFFHKYKDNEKDEKPMQEYAESLGYRFTAAWAYLMPVEKMLAIDDPAKAQATLTKEDLALVNRLALEPQESLRIAGKHKINNCDLYDFLTIDINADLFICCASSGKPTNKLGNFLELSMSEIRAKQKKHSLCGPCMKAGLPVIYGHADPNFDKLGFRERQRYSKTNKRNLTVEN